MNKDTSHVIFLKLTKAERFEAIEMLIKKLNSFDEVKIFVSALDLYLSRPTTTCTADFADEDKGNDSAEDADTDNVANEVSKNLKVYSKIQTGHLAFSCEYCDKKFKSQARFKFHVKQFHTGELLFPCENCDKQLTSERNYKCHMKLYHDDEREVFSCKKCDKKCISEANLYKHNKRVHEKGGHFICDICSKPWAFKADLEKHRRVHTGETSERYYKCHMKLYHDDEKEVFSCKKCDKKCISKGNLYKHNKRVQEKGERFICDICSKPWAFKTDLEKHRRVHTGENAYDCSICPKRVNQKSNLNSHTKYVHEKKTEVNTFPAKSLQCPIREKKSFLREICNNKLSSKLSYERHTKLRHDNQKEKELFPCKLFPCENCDKLLTSESKYKRHMKLYHDDENVVFSCKKCNKRFISKGGLNVHHKRVHEEIERFICHLCSKPWGTKSDLERHIRVHTGEKPYTCSICSKAFNRFDHVKSHVQAVHKEENENMPSKKSKNV